MKRPASSLVSLTAATVLALVAHAADARAEGPDSSPTAAPAAPKVQPDPGQAAAAAPAPSSIPITATCSLGDHPGISEAEARTGADIVCHELAKARATNTAHEIRFGTLGGKTMVTVASRNGNAYDERRVFLAGLDELHVAAPRLATSLASGKSLDETREVDNVLASETRQSKVQRGQVGFDGGFFGTTALGAAAGASGGIDLGLLYRGGSFGLSSHGRAGGIGSAERKIGLATFDVGARLYLSSSEIAPFVGAGLGLAYVSLSRDAASGLEGSGFAGHVVVGVELLRSHHTAASLSVRVDTPFFEIASRDASAYVMPASLNVGLLFH